MTLLGSPCRNPQASSLIFLSSKVRLYAEILTNLSNWRIHGVLCRPTARLHAAHPFDWREHCIERSRIPGGNLQRFVCVTDRRESLARGAL